MLVSYLNVFSTESNTFSARLKCACLEMAGTSVSSDTTSSSVKPSEL